MVEVLITGRVWWSETWPSMTDSWTNRNNGIQQDSQAEPDTSFMKTKQKAGGPSALSTSLRNSNSVDHRPRTACTAAVWAWLTAEREVLIKNVSWRFTHTCLRVTHVWSSLKESAVHQTTECIRISSFVNSVVVISDLTTCNCLQHKTFLSQHVALVVIKISVVSGRSIDALIYFPTVKLHR